MAEMWLPDNYEVPESEPRYMKFQKGTNRFRIMSRPIIGWEYWTEDEDGRHPNRVKNRDEIPKDMNGEAKHFWAFIVWNSDAETFQILEITQKTVQKAIRSLASDVDWGNPEDYDIVVERSGEDLRTEYTVNPKPVKKLDKTVLTAFNDFTCNLSALYDGGDPFAAEEVEDENEVPF